MISEKRKSDFLFLSSLVFSQHPRTWEAQFQSGIKVSVWKATPPAMKYYIRFFFFFFFFYLNHMALKTTPCINLQTIALIAVREGVVQLGSVHKVSSLSISHSFSFSVICMRLYNGVYIGHRRFELCCDAKKEVQLHRKHPRSASTTPIIFSISNEDRRLWNPSWCMALPSLTRTPNWILRPLQSTSIKDNSFHEQPWSPPL